MSLFSHPACAEPDVDPAWFFPEKGHPKALQPARQICARCPHLYPCQEYALAIPWLHGIWGGLSELDRRLIRQNRW